MTRELLIKLLDVKEYLCENLCEGDICYNCSLWRIKEEALSEVVKSLPYSEVNTKELTVGDIIYDPNDEEKLVIIGSVNVDEQNNNVSIYVFGYELMIEDSAEIEADKSIKVYGHIDPPFDNWLIDFLAKDT